jgi:hypothetical protein
MLSYTRDRHWLQAHLCGAICISFHIYDIPGVFTFPSTRSSTSLQKVSEDRTCGDTQSNTNIYNDIKVCKHNNRSSWIQILDITRTDILKKRDSQRWEEHTKQVAGWLEKQGLLGSYMSSWSPWSDPTTQRLETTNVSYTFAYWIQIMKWNFIYPGSEESIPNAHNLFIVDPF